MQEPLFQKNRIFWAAPSCPYVARCGVLQHVLPYAWAIALQAIFFTAFLFQIGFRGWIVPLVFMYAMFQAYVFHKTKTLLITLVVHILIDLTVFINLFLAAHNIV